MDTLVYKRTHRGDPDESGIFGLPDRDCMGPIRRWSFDAVIGVGGKRPDRGDEDIALKVNWVGIGPRKTEVPGLTGPRVEFERFFLWNETGPYLKTLAPKLYKYMFEDGHVRVVKSASLSTEMQEEVTKILRFAETRKPTTRRALERNTTTKRKC